MAPMEPALMRRWRQPPQRREVLLGESVQRAFERIEDPLRIVRASEDETIFDVANVLHRIRANLVNLRTRFRLFLYRVEVGSEAQRALIEPFVLFASNDRTENDVATDDAVDDLFGRQLDRELISVVAAVARLRKLLIELFVEALDEVLDLRCVHVIS